MTANDGNHPVRESFPGIAIPDGTGAPGSSGASGSAADDAGAGHVTLASGAWQEGARYPAATGGTVMPGQSGQTVISPGPDSGPDSYTDTGAGHGRTMTSEAHRYPWQQPAGGA
jgi:hypothetical protein